MSGEGAFRALLVRPCSFCGGPWDGYGVHFAGEDKLACHGCLARAHEAAPPLLSVLAALPQPSTHAES